MSTIASVYQPSRPALSQVMAELSYLQKSGDPAFTCMYDPPAGIAQSNCEYQSRCLPILDARCSISPPSIEKEGFELWDAPSTVADFWDEDAVVTTYYVEAAELVRVVTGASRVYIFDHILRKREQGRPRLTFGRRGDGSFPGAAGRIHNDYSESSGRSKLPLVITDAEQRKRIDRYSIVNVWRSVNGPVLDTPLALCDAQTVSTLDMVPCEVRRQQRAGEIYLARYSHRHKWYYYSAMNRHEVLVFKQFDSQISGVSRITPHAAFDHPDIPADAPLRESIELRCLVVY